MTAEDLPQIFHHVDGFGRAATGADEADARKRAAAEDLPQPTLWARNDELLFVRTRGGLMCSLYPDTNGRTDLEPLYTRAAMDAAVAQERERCAAIVQANADACLTDLLRNVLASNAAAIRAQDQG